MVMRNHRGEKYLCCPDKSEVVDREGSKLGQFGPYGFGVEVLQFNVAWSSVKQGLSATDACTGYYAGWITDLPGLCKYLHHREGGKDKTRTDEETRRQVPTRIC